MMVRRVSALGFAGVCLLAGCARDVVSAEGAEIHGATPDEAAELDAIGSLHEDDGSGREFFCTGTLVTPSVVLTARHCGVVPSETRTVTFSIGADARAPRRTVKVIASLASQVRTEGLGSKTSDVRLALLAEPILDVTPIPPAATPLSAADVGRMFTIAGFGRTGEGDEHPAGALRRTAPQRLEAVAGSPRHALFPTPEAWEEHVVAGDVASGAMQPGEPLSPERRAMIRARYDKTLASGFEVWTRGDQTQLCKGDSGGPLLGLVGAQRVVYGVASATVEADCADGGGGAIHATLGPGTREVVDDAMACRGAFALPECRPAH